LGTHAIFGYPRKRNPPNNEHEIPSDASITNCVEHATLETPDCRLSHVGPSLISILEIHMPSYNCMRSARKAPGGAFRAYTYGKSNKLYSYVGTFDCCFNVLISVRQCIILSAARVWLAGQRQSSSTPFMWNPHADVAIAVSYDNWDNGSPTNANCMTMNPTTGFWSNAKCSSTQLYVLCEFDN
jgi:Lectin C-type domain